MKNWLKLAAIALLVVGVGLAALAMSGVWPRRSQADLEQARAHTEQANAHLQSGDQDAALRSLDESIRLYPLADAQSMRASMRMARNDFQGALRDVSAVIGRGGRTAQNYSLRCWLRVRLDALDRARADCDEALRLDPAHASAFGNRGLIGLKRRHYRDAWEDFNAALRVGGSDQWVAWRLFGRGIAAWGQGRVTQGRQDVELALRGHPGVAAEFAQFGLGVELMRELDDAAYAAAMSPRSLLALEQYLYLYPSGAHVTEARAQVEEIYAWIATDEAAGQRTLPGFSLAQSRGPGSASDSYGAIAISRSTWRIAFSTDYATGEDAERAAAGVCNAGAVRDCDAFAFRNVCAALAISPTDRRRGLAWAHARDDALRTAVAGCRQRGGRACVPVHSQCTPTPEGGAAMAAASPG